jgi:hypothetical protein
MLNTQVLVGYGYDLTDSPVWYQLAWKTSRQL